MKTWLMNILVGFPTFLAFGYCLTFFGESSISATLSRNV